MEIKHEREKTDWLKYFYTFVITALIFATAIYVSNYFSDKKLSQMKIIGDKISLDILSSETQFSLLTETSCKNISDNTLSKEVGQLGEKLSYTEEKVGPNNLDFQNLKTYYSLLEIKDYLLMKKISEKCKDKFVFILYFYSNKNSCPECQNEGYILTKLHEMYPKIRIYSFDYDFNIPVMETLKSIYNIENKLPALFINGEVFYGFKNIDDIKKIIPETKIWDKENLATSTSVK
ncbi:MAG: thioredoxin family protein [bacterium]